MILGAPSNADCRSSPLPNAALKPTTYSWPASSASQSAKLRQRQFTEDGNVEITGRDLRYIPGEDRTDTRGSISNRDPKQSLVAGDRNGRNAPFGTFADRGLEASALNAVRCRAI
jgi:hypothetical protein